MIQELENKEVTLHEILVKTSYQTQVNRPSDLHLTNPVAFGSGFIISFYDKSFFVTADHVLHLDDYTEGIKQRNWIDNVVSIFNNVRPENEFLSTIITPLGGFYYMEKFNLDKPDQVSELVDITLCIMKPINFQYPFLTDEVVFTGEIINAGEQKWVIKKECFTLPNVENKYFIFGKIRTKLEGIILKSEPTLKEDLIFINQIGDYFLFNTNDIIISREDWDGLSGSPVIDINGNCVGVLCSINEKSKSVWVMPFDNVKRLMEVAIQQEVIH